MNAVRNILCAALTALGALALNVSAAAAPPSAVQIETIAAAEALWRDDALAGQTDRQDGMAFDPARMRFAVTDLDGNGRLELLFCHGMWGAESMHTLPEYLQNMPTALGMSAYEIGEDGCLVRLPDVECSGGTPNLTTLDSFHPMVKDGIRRYNLRTEQLHIDADGRMRCSELYQRVALKDSSLTCELLAEGWRLVRTEPPDSGGTVGLPSQIYDGDPEHRDMPGVKFSVTPFILDFQRNHRVPSGIYWMKGEELLKNPCEALTTSWYTFAYHSV